PPPLLFAAARFGCQAQARALLDRGAAIDAKDREGKTALAKAAEADKLPLIKLLLERGANVNARAVNRCPPRPSTVRRKASLSSRSLAPIPTRSTTTVQARSSMPLATATPRLWRC